MEKRELLSTVSGIASGTIEKSIDFPKKIKNTTIMWPAISLPGIYLNKTKILIKKSNMLTNIHWNIIYNSQDIEAT